MKKGMGIDEFGVKRNLCACGEFAYWWDGKNHICYECLKRNSGIQRYPKTYLKATQGQMLKAGYKPVEEIDIEENSD